MYSKHNLLLLILFSNTLVWDTIYNLSNIIKLLFNITHEHLYCQLKYYLINTFFSSFEIQITYICLYIFFYKISCKTHTHSIAYQNIKYYLINVVYSGRVR